MSSAREYAKQYRVRIKTDPERRARYLKLMRDTNRKAYHADPRRFMLRAALKRAIAHDLPFNLSIDDFSIPESCPVLSMPLRVGSGKGTQQNSPTLDRFIPENGYVRGNVHVISWKANSIKNNGTPEEVMLVAQWMHRTHQNRINT